MAAMMMVKYTTDSSSRPHLVENQHTVHDGLPKALQRENMVANRMSMDDSTMAS